MTTHECGSCTQVQELQDNIQLLEGIIDMYQDLEHLTDGQILHLKTTYNILARRHGEVLLPL